MAAGRRRLVIAASAILLLCALFAGLAQLHQSRERYNAFHDAAADLATAAVALSALQWEAMADGGVEGDELDEAHRLIAEGDRQVATIADVHRDGHEEQLRQLWSRYSGAVMEVLRLVQRADLRAADDLDERTVEPAREELAALVITHRSEAERLDGWGDRAQVLGSIGLIVGAFAALAAAVTFAQRRRHAAAVAEVLHRAQDALRHQATHDELTGLANRTVFRQVLAERTRAAHRTGAAMAVLLVDLDRFKEVNDTLGHHTGDDLLRSVARRLRSAVRDGDLVARLGGDEFAVVVADVHHASVPVRLAQRILEALATPISVGGVALAVETSIGVAVCPTHAEDADQLFRRADAAMYEAKLRGNAFAVYNPQEDTGDGARLALLSDLRDALRGGDEQLSLVFQPQYDPVTGEVRAVEALLRWRHPTEGFVPPSAFIPLAEQTSLIDALTTFVLDRALAQLAAWDRMGTHLRVAVNVSVRNLVDERLPGVVTGLLARHGIAPDRLEIEITETAVMTDPGRVTRVLERIGALGVRLAMDDYGTGYSSLAFLRQLPLDAIKIDRSFIASMADSHSDRAIVASTINLARELGLQVVAEGVETHDELALLTAHRCDAVQGYLLSRPVEAHAIPEAVRAFRGLATLVPAGR